MQSVWLRHWFEQQCRRHAVRSLDHARQELPGDAAGFLVHAEGTEIVVHRTLPVDAHGGQIVEDHG